MNASISVADHYTAAIGKFGKFEVEALFNPETVKGDTRPATLDVKMTLGEVGYD